MMREKHAIVNGHKVCSHCGKNKPVSEYYPDNRKRRKPGSVRPLCKVCDIVVSRNWAKEHPEYVAYKQRYSRLRHYNMSVGQFNGLLAKQGGSRAEAVRFVEPDLLGVPSISGM